MTEYVRKMASIQEVNGVFPIKNADKICQYGIMGWRVVDLVGKYQIGDKVVFIEVDGFVPSTLAIFLTKPGHYPKTYNGVEGERLRTIKLRGALSQGLILPLEPTCSMIESELRVGDDVSYPLGIQKWEPPPEFSSADAKGLFPSYIRKTDQPRIQNVYDDVVGLFDKVTFEVSEKCEGASMTVYYNQGEFGVCSRNLDLKEDVDNTFWKTALSYDIKNKLISLGKNIAFQGELCGPGVQGNIYKLPDHKWFIFDIFDIDSQTYYEPESRRAIVELLELDEAPVLYTDLNLQDKPLSWLVDHADGQSAIGQLGCLREGLVYKANTPERVSFKTVSNFYLLKQKD